MLSCRTLRGVEHPAIDATDNDQGRLAAHFCEPLDDLDTIDAGHDQIEQNVGGAQRGIVKKLQTRLLIRQSTGPAPA
jgi:hypothetical protein